MRRLLLSGAPSGRAGFSLVELLTVFVLVAVLSMVVGPRLGAVRAGSAVRAARLELGAAVDAARAAAMQRGRPARVVVRGDRVTASVDTGAAGRMTLVDVPLDAEYGVTTAFGTPADTLVAFDGRGLASPRLGRVARIVVRYPAPIVRDSICVSSLGQLLPRGCRS